MFRQGDLYSTFVVWLKVILPMFALALLSTLFLFSGKVDVTQSIPYATLNVGEIVKEQRISRPYFEGTTSNGAEITLTAAYAKPDAEKPDLFTAEDLQLRLRSQDGRALRLTSGHGVISPEMAQLDGGVTTFTSGGLTIKAQEITANLKSQIFETQTGISATSEIGILTADTMRMHQNEQGLEIQFTGNVRLIYQP